ncbi:hypothetical protein E2C01_093150 [Portunus trituberculatus]|uniref:Uncharacterized protein n=1 Tax=Portunus trituberculatus TaxID=210409 RepID=A0A5B7JT91_PORTR|nr:hypothetical protein [Portunus trituberculatus]
MAFKGPELKHHPAFHLLPAMGQVYERNKQSKNPWNMSMEAQRIKSVLNLPPQMLQYTPSRHLTTATPQPTTSQQKKDKEMKKKRPHYSQLEKLFYKILRKELKMWIVTTSLPC